MPDITDPDCSCGYGATISYAYPDPMPIVSPEKEAENVDLTTILKVIHLAPLRHALFMQPIEPSLGIISIFIEVHNTNQA